MNIRLIAFDLDGTLLNSEKTVSPRTKAALTRAAEHGVVLVPATGRLHRDLPADVAALPSLRYVIAINGAEVFDLKEDRLLYQAELDRTDALELMKYMDTLPAIYGWYQGGQGFISSRYYERMKDFAHAPWLFDSMKRAYTRRLFWRKRADLRSCSSISGTWKRERRLFWKYPDFFLSAQSPLLFLLI